MPRFVQSLYPALVIAMASVTPACRSTDSHAEAAQVAPGQTVRFPRAFANGQKLLYRKANGLCGDAATAGWGTQGQDVASYVTFNLNDRVLTVAPEAGAAPLVGFPVVNFDSQFIDVDFAKAYDHVDELEGAHDAQGKAILTSEGAPAQVATKTYAVLPGSSSLKQLATDTSVLVAQDLKLVSQYQDAYTPAAYVCQVQYSFAVPPAPLPFTPIVLADPGALARFFTDDQAGFAKVMNLNRPLTIHPEAGMTPSVQAGIAAGAAYWNALFGRTVFIIGAPASRGEFFFAANLVRVVPQAIRGAGSLAQNDPLTGELLQPGYELQFPHEFSDDPLPANGDSLDQKLARQYAYASAHELGHVLGLQHNFAFILRPGDGDLHCVSVMCYAAAEETQRVGQSVLEGKQTQAYDKLAIDYLYGGPAQGKTLPGPFQADPR